MGWKTGFEPATSGTTIQRSNQLSYNHHFVNKQVKTPSERFSPDTAPLFTGFSIPVLGGGKGTLFYETDQKFFILNSLSDWREFLVPG